MGDMAEVFNDMKEAAKIRKKETFNANMETLYESEFNYPRRFELKEEISTVLFRERGKPLVSFYPSTNRWVIRNVTKYGNAAAFLNWYRKQGKQ